MTFNYWVKYKRRKMGLSQRTLAVQAGLFLGTIVRIEKYGSSPQGKTQRKIESVLGVYNPIESNEGLGLGVRNPSPMPQAPQPILNDLALAKAQGILNRVIRHSEETIKNAKEALEEIAKLL